MLQILYTNDHLQRGVALAGEEAGSAHGLINIAPAAKGVTTLLFWGHGDNYGLCTKNATELAEIIKAWKALNATMHTVELVTCNARHYTGATDSFANQLKSKLGGFFSSTKNLVLKGLPVTRSGSINAFSILLAEAPSKSWVYVTGPGGDDSEMMRGASLIKFQKIGERTVSFRGDIAQRADEMVRLHKGHDRQWTMNYGYFNTLRKNLVVVK
jgi:hypothetical protein